MEGTTIQEVAREALDWLEVATKTDGETRYVRTKDGAPEWMSDLVYKAHDEFGPDDWRYECIRDALAFISGADGDEEEWAHDFANQQVDVYTAARTTWLASNLNRLGYVDAARDEGLVSPTADLADMIGVGQYEEASDVFHSVVASLEARVEVLA